MSRASRSSSPLLLGSGAILLAVYAAPLFYPPTPVPPGTPAPPAAWLLERILPGVPLPWTMVRLAALTAAAVLLAAGPSRLMRRPLRSMTSGSPSSRLDIFHVLALLAASVQVAMIPLAPRLGPAGQTSYLGMLFLPAALLALPDFASARIRPRRWRRGGCTAAVILSWVALRLVTDLGSPRVADAADLWAGFVEILRFVTQKKSLLTDVLDPDAAAIRGIPLVFHGVPLFQADVLPFTFRSLQLFQVVCMAACAVAVSRLARVVVGPAGATIAAAVFLFAPYTRYMTLFPSPTIAGPLYATAVALGAVTIARRRSEAALAALGAISGIAVTFSSVLPVVVFFVAWVVWRLRESWPSVRVGAVVALASFAAAVAPALPDMLTRGAAMLDLPWQGPIGMIDAGLLGQLPLHPNTGVSPDVHRRPFDTIVAALLAPFAHPRIGIRLWGDALFDPLGAVLIAIGVAVSARSARDSSLARMLLAFLVVALCPAFVSPFDVADMARAVALPVPAALLAAAGFSALQRSATLGRMTAAALAICLGGTVLFDVVNPRVLSASSLGIMFEVMPMEIADRVVVLAHGPNAGGEVRMPFTGPITAFGGSRPVGYLEYEGGDLPAADLTAEGKELFFWSHGLDRDVDVMGAICRAWPFAVFFEISDHARLGRLHGALVGGAPWWPRVADARWRSWNCTSREIESRSGD